MSEVFIKLNVEWRHIQPISNLIFVICPGAGCYSNRHAYKYLEQNYTLEYFWRSGKDNISKYDIYPNNWENNNFVQNTGFHLGGISLLIKNYIENGYIPEAIICGSRGSQVTIGKVWESIWRGPTLAINAGCLTTSTPIPDGVNLVFIIMGNDYFKTVNSISKVKILFDKFKINKDQKGKVFYLPHHKHMPNLNTNMHKLIYYGISHLLKKIEVKDLKSDELIIDTI